MIRWIGCRSRGLAKISGRVSAVEMHASKEKAARTRDPEFRPGSKSARIRAIRGFSFEPSPMEAPGLLQTGLLARGGQQPRMNADGHRWTDRSLCFPWTGMDEMDGMKGNRIFVVRPLNFVRFARFVVPPSEPRLPGIPGIPWFHPQSPGIAWSRGSSGPEVVPPNPRPSCSSAVGKVRPRGFAAAPLPILPSHPAGSPLPVRSRPSRREDRSPSW